MQSNLLPWLNAIPSVVWVLVYIGSLIFLVNMRANHRRAAQRAILGVSLFLLIQIATTMFGLLYPRVYGADSFVFFFVGSQLISNLGRVAAFVIILSAIFVDRDPVGAEVRPAFGQGNPKPSVNPYVPPAS